MEGKVLSCNLSPLACVETIKIPELGRVITGGIYQTDRNHSVWFPIGQTGFKFMCSALFVVL